MGGYDGVTPSLKLCSKQLPFGIDLVSLPELDGNVVTLYLKRRSLGQR